MLRQILSIRKLTYLAITAILVVTFVYVVSDNFSKNVTRYIDDNFVKGSPVSVSMDEENMMSSRVSC